MKKVKGYLKCVLAGLLLSVAPMSAMAEDVNFPNITTLSELPTILGETGVGVVIAVGADNAGSVWNWTEGNKPYSTNGGNPTIKIGNINVANFEAPAKYFGVSGVVIDNYSGGGLSLDKTTIDIGNIDISLTGTGSSQLAGFTYFDNMNQAFDGTLKIGDVNITNTDDNVFGIGFTDTDGNFETDIAGKVIVGNITTTLTDNTNFVHANGFAAGDITGIVTVGDINTSSRTGAFGFYANDIIGTVTVDDINTTTATGNARGFAADDITGTVTVGNITTSLTDNTDYVSAAGFWAHDITGTVTVGDINTSSTTGAVGFLADDIDGTVTVGNITATVTATATEGYAVGFDAYDIDGTVTVGNITATATNADGYGYAVGFDAYDIDGTVTVGDITATSTNGNDFGNARGFEAGDITGTVTVGNITATATNVDGYASAVGFLADDIINGAKVQIGNVKTTVTSAGDGDIFGGVSGVFVGLIGDGTLTVGNVDVTSARQEEHPSFVSGVGVGSIAQDGSLKVGDVNVVSTGTDVNVTGIYVNGTIAAPAEGESATGKFDVGRINVKSAADAIGIDVQPYTDGESTFTVTKDVIVTSTANSADGFEVVGIRTAGGKQNLTINTDAGDVQITGTTADNVVRSIELGNGTNNSLTITGENKHTNKGQVFDVRQAQHIRWETDADYVDGSRFVTNGNNPTTHQVATGKTAVINGEVNTFGGTYSVGSDADNKSAGTIVIQNLQTGNAAVNVNNGMLALDGTKNHQIGALTIGNDNKAANAQASVALYGNTAPDSLALKVADPVVKANAVVDPVTKEKILSVSTISEYKWFGVDATHAAAGYYSSNRKRASLADGFLLPASIHNRTTAWEATRDHLISGSRQAKFSKEFRGQSSCEPCEPASCDPCDPCNSGKVSVKRSAWVNYVGRSNSYRSSYSNIGIENGDWEIGTDGVQVGLDLYKTSKTQLGLLFGYEGSVAKLRSDRLEADDVYLGVYAARVFNNGADFRAIYNYGSQDYKLSRLDPGLGLNWHTHNSAFNGNTNEVTLEFGKRIFRNRYWSYRPVIGFDLLINNWDGALEDGNLSTAIAYGDADYTQAFLRVGTDLKYVKGGFELFSGIYYSYDLNDEELQSKVFARQNNKSGYNPAIASTLVGSELGRSVLTFNIGGSLACSKRFSIFGGFTGDATLDRDGNGFQSIGYVGSKLNW